jgi:hypothetical protein
MVSIFVSFLGVRCSSTHQNKSLKLKRVEGGYCTKPIKCFHCQNIMAFVCTATISHLWHYTTPYFVQPYLLHPKCTYWSFNKTQIFLCLQCTIVDATCNGKKPNIQNQLMLLDLTYIMVHLPRALKWTFNCKPSRHML